MRFRPMGLTALLLSLLSTAAVIAKQDVVATLLTAIPTNASEGTPVTVAWSLQGKDSHRPFNACDVFVRLVGPNGDSTEAFATPCREVAEGRYSAVATVPRGGLSGIVIGLAGTGTSGGGHSQRSDALFDLTNDPFEAVAR